MIVSQAWLELAHPRWSGLVNGLDSCPPLLLMFGCFKGLDETGSVLSEPIEKFADRQVNDVLQRLLAYEQTSHPQLEATPVGHSVTSR
jgi:hypothetical protein